MNTDKIRREAEGLYPQLKDCPTPCILTSEELAEQLQSAYLTGATRDAWVRVEDELPPYGSVLVCLSNHCVTELVYSGLTDRFLSPINQMQEHDNESNPVIAWQPLPPPPST